MGVLDRVVRLAGSMPVHVPRVVSLLTAWHNCTGSPNVHSLAFCAGRICEVSFYCHVVLALDILQGHACFDESPRPADTAMQCWTNTSALQNNVPMLVTTEDLEPLQLSWSSSYHRPSAPGASRRTRVSCTPRSGTSFATWAAQVRTSCRRPCPRWRCSAS
jgi:hypothetical protein